MILKSWEGERYEKKFFFNNSIKSALKSARKCNLGTLQPCLPNQQLKLTFFSKKIFECRGHEGTLEEERIFLNKKVDYSSFDN